MSPAKTRPPTTSQQDLVDELLGRHGELVSGKELMRCLGFRSARAFSRAATLGHVPVAVFQMNGRRGWFARTRDVGTWLSGLGTGGTPELAVQDAISSDPPADRSVGSRSQSKTRKEVGG